MFNEELNNITQLMELEIKEEPKIIVNAESAPRSLIGQLIVNKFIPSYQEASEDLKWLVEGEGDVKRDTSIHILDLLGVYKSGKNEIILYELLIKLASIKLKVDFEALKMIVLLHEISHAVTHRGLDKEGKIWTFFEVASPEIKEYFAQIYVYKLLEKEGKVNSLEVMDQLSEIQPDVYQRYKESLNLDIKKLNEELYKERKKIPVEYSDYPEALKREWSIFFSNLRREPNPHYVPPSALRDLIDVLDYTDPSTGVVNLDQKKLVEERHKKMNKKWLTSGTEFKIIANRIDIRSYDYSPSDNTLAIDETCELFKLILKNFSDLHNHNISTIIEHYQFSVTIDRETFQMDLKNPFALDFFNRVIGVLNKRYPVLVKVLKGYSF